MTNPVRWLPFLWTGSLVNPSSRKVYRMEQSKQQKQITRLNRLISRHSASRGFYVLWGPLNLLTQVCWIRLNEGDSPLQLTNSTNRQRCARWQPTACLPRPRWRGCWFSFPERISFQHRHTSSLLSTYRVHLSSNLSPICPFRRHMVKPNREVARGAIHTVC